MLKMEHFPCRVREGKLFYNKTKRMFVPLFRQPRISPPYFVVVINRPWSKIEA